MEYKIISSNFRYRHKEKRNTEVSVKTVSYNKYNQFLISAIKGITKNSKTITNNYESLFYSMKDQCKKKIHISSQAIHSNFPVLFGSILHL